MKVPAIQPVAQVERRRLYLRGQRIKSAYLRVFLGILALSALTGCSSFSRDWKKAAAQPIAGSIEGRWEGQWVSDGNGHNGALRCLMNKDGENTVKARFRATYAKVLSFSYTVSMTLEPHFDGFEVNGEADLGKLAGGMYYYEGRISPTNFFSTYRSKYDHGVFQLHRPD